MIIKIVLCYAHNRVCRWPVELLITNSSSICSLLFAKALKSHLSALKVNITNRFSLAMAMHTLNSEQYMQVGSFATYHIYRSLWEVLCAHKCAECMQYPNGYYPIALISILHSVFIYRYFQLTADNRIIYQNRNATCGRKIIFTNGNFWFINKLYIFKMVPFHTGSVPGQYRKTIVPSFGRNDRKTI